MKLFLVHGWSFDASIWAPLQAACRDAEAVCAECGYWGAPPMLQPPPAPYLAVGHSAGALWLLEQTLPGCLGIVAINGFARFTQAPDAPFGQTPRVLDRMRRALTRDPMRVVTDFRTIIGADQPTETPIPLPLAHGLDRLAQSDAREQARHWGARLHAVAGLADPLVDPRHMRETFGPACTMTTLPGGHLLPLTHTAACSDVLRAAWARWA